MRRGAQLEYSLAASFAISASPQGTMHEQMLANNARHCMRLAEDFLKENDTENADLAYQNAMILFDKSPSLSQTKWQFQLGWAHTLMQSRSSFESVNHSCGLQILKELEAALDAAPVENCINQYQSLLSLYRWLGYSKTHQELESKLSFRMNMCGMAS